MIVFADNGRIVPASFRTDHPEMFMIVHTPGHNSVLGELAGSSAKADVQAIDSKQIIIAKIFIFFLAYFDVDR